MFTSKKMILFGTGTSAEILLKSTDLNIAYIIDNDEKKWGETFYNKKIYSPKKVKEEISSEILIVLAFFPSGPTYMKVSNQLKKMGFIEKQHFINMYEILPDEFPYEEIKPLSTYSPWKEDADFQEVYTIIGENTLVDKYRCFELWSLIEQVSHLNGAMIEIGVWKGGTGALLAKKAESCGIKDPIYLCDTFSGVVKASSKHDNIYIGGEHSDTSEKVVKELIFDNMKLENVKILKGIFPDETAEFIEDQMFRFCHIDVDVFYSAKDIFEWIWDKLVIGGVIVFDDYGFIACEGITKYVNEIKKQKNVVFLHNINGHGVLVKISN